VEHFKIHRPGKRCKLIAKSAQSREPVFNIKEARLLHLPSFPINAGKMES